MALALWHESQDCSPRGTDRKRQAQANVLNDSKPRGRLDEIDMGAVPPLAHGEHHCLLSGLADSAQNLVKPRSPDVLPVGSLTPPEYHSSKRPGPTSRSADRNPLLLQSHQQPVRGSRGETGLPGNLGTGESLIIGARQSGERPRDPGYHAPGVSAVIRRSGVRTGGTHGQPPPSSPYNPYNPWVDECY